MGSITVSYDEGWAGATLERLVEPRPLRELGQDDAGRYERLSRGPCFLAVRPRTPLTGGDPLVAPPSA